MESVQKFILSTALFLLIITIGTHKSYAKIVDDSTFYTSFYQQQKTPFEKTIHFLFLNKLADLPQPVCSLEVISGHSSCKSLFCLPSDSNNLYNTTSKPYVASFGPQRTDSYPGIEYYIYTLRRILI